MTSTHKVSPARSRRVPRSVYDAFIPPGRATRSAATEAPRARTHVAEIPMHLDLSSWPTADDGLPTTGLQTTTDWFVSGAVDHLPLHPSPVAPAVVDADHVAPATTASPAVGESPVETAAPEVRAEALAWLRDLAGGGPLD